MKKFTLILTSMLFLLVCGGGVKVCAQTPLVLKGGSNWDGSSGGNLGNNGNYTSDVIQFKDKRAQYSYMTNNDWVDATEGTHTFVVTLGSSNNEDCTLHIAALYEVVSGSSFDNGNIKSGIIIKEESISVTNNATLTLSVSSGYAAIILWQTSNNDWRKVNIASFTREIGSGGGGGSASDGKTAVTYNIPGKNVLFSDSFDDNLNKWGKLNEDDGTVDWDGTIGHDSNGCMKVVNYTSRNSDQWKIQRHADFSKISSGTTFYVTFYIKCESGTGSIRCSTTGHAQYQGDQNVTTEWQKIVWEVTAEGNIDGLCLDMAHTANTYYIDDVEVYTNAATGGSNVFTSDEQVANIASSAFTNLTAGDYICADVTGTPETIKLICNGSDYALTQFNGSNLWGIKATADMVSALQANNSQFKGHDLTLNGIDIYKTVALGEGDNSTALASKINNVFVELTRSFVANTWNTVCLPFVPSAEQATALFGEGYQLAEFTGVSGTTMQFTTIAIGSFVAGKPYLVMPKTGCATGTTVLFDVDITAKNPTPVTFGDYTFTGTFTTKTFSGNECSTSRFVATGNELMKPTDNSTLKSLRCYFTVPAAAAAARSLSFDVDEEGNTTGVADINRETITNNGDFFNLAGQRVAQPTKGLYIVNGKKVVIK